jgi:hypothetical protein
MGFYRAEARIREYCEIEVYRDRNYKGGYDDRHNVTNSITKDDLESANNLYARMRQADFKRILGSPEIPTMLAALGDPELGMTTDEEWESTKELVRPLLAAFLSIHNVKLAKTMKVLHLKRPHLFPILDSFVVKFLTGNDIEENWFSEEELLRIGMDSLEISRRDIRNNWAAFADLQGRLADLPVPLTTVRLYDILCWSEEKWVNHNDIVAPNGVASKSLDQSERPVEPTSSASPTPAADLGKDLIEPAGEMTSGKEFRRIVGGAEGVVVITGTTPPRAHSPLCSLVTEDRFNQNVSIDKGRSAKYYWRASLVEARKEFGAVPCKRCRPGGTTPSVPKW